MCPRNSIPGAALAAALFAAGAAHAQRAAATAEEVARELANPLAPVTTLAAQVRAEFGNGPDDERNFQFRLQPSFFKPLPETSALLVRTILPLRFNRWPIDENGLGDVTIVPYYVPDLTKSTFAGFGGALIVPTANKDSLGSGKWSAGPAAIVAVTGSPLTWGGLAQHVWSFAGDKARGDISVTTLQPFATVVLGGGWAVAINAEAAYNWKASSERWTVPVALGVSKVVEVGGQYLNLSMSVVRYVERPSFAPSDELRFNVTYVIR